MVGLLGLLVTVAQAQSTPPSSTPVSGYRGWMPVGAQSSQTPSISLSGSILEVVSLGPNGVAQHHRLTNDTWIPSGGPGGIFSQPPALAGGAGGALEMVGVGADSSVYHGQFLGDQWSAFQPIGGPTSQPTALAFNPTANAAELVIVETDNRLLHSRFTNGRWTSFAEVGGSAPTAPALVFNPQGNLLDLLFVGADRTLFHTRFAGSSWGAPASTGGETALPPAMVALPDGALEAAITAPDGQVFQNRLRNGAWQGWKPVAGLQSSVSPTLTFSSEGNATELYAVGPDGQLRHSRRLGDTWSAPVALGAVGPYRAAATAGANGLVEVVATGQDGNLWHNRFQAKAAEREVLFAKEIQPIFTANCRCHSGGAPLEGMNLGAGRAFANTVNVPSRQSNLNRIEPGDPDKSYLLHKLNGTQRTVGGGGSRMPLGGRLSAGQIEKIRQWIAQGAKND
jgi:hypothetical protein